MSATIVTVSQSALDLKPGSSSVILSHLINPTLTYLTVERHGCDREK